MRTTKEVAQELGISAAALRAHVAAGNVVAPRRRVGIMFLWTAAEVEAARQALAVPGRRRPRYLVDALAKGGGHE